MIRFTRTLAAAAAAALLSTACVNVTVHSGQGHMPAMQGKHAGNEAEIAALFDRWNASLATGNPDNVVANYADGRHPAAHRVQ